MIIIVIVAACVLCFFGGMWLQKKKGRAEAKQRTLFGPWPIPQISIHELGPLFAPTPLGPSHASETLFLPNIRVKGGISDLETWILSVCAKHAKRIFEFGTCSGKTAYLMARNSSPDSHIFTLTLPPEDLSTYTHAQTDSSLSHQEALSESCFNTFYYSGTPEASKITQLYADSKQFDDTSYASSCDLIFIDGSHAYSYVLSDTEKALRIAKPGALIFWHDYRGPKRNRDVYQALNELSTHYPLRHITGTSLVVLSKPAP